MNASAVILTPPPAPSRDWCDRKDPTCILVHEMPCIRTPDAEYWMARIECLD